MTDGFIIFIFRGPALAAASFACMPRGARDALRKFFDDAQNWLDNRTDKEEFYVCLKYILNILM